MYQRPSKPNDDTKPIQSVDWWTFRKKNLEIVCGYDKNTLILYGDFGGSILTVLGFYHFLSDKSLSIKQKQMHFNKFTIDQCPKQFQPYLHQKTLKQILNILQQKSQNVESLIELMNEYPITIFIFQVYCRQVCVNYITDNEDLLQLWGNQIDILQDYQKQPRGNLLEVLANSLNLYLILNCKGLKENYGKHKNSQKITISLFENKIQAQSSKKVNYQIYTQKPIQSQSKKASRDINSKETQSSENPHTNPQSPSSPSNRTENKAQQFLKCQSCKQIKTRCVCSTRKTNMPSYGNNTPRNHGKIERNKNNVNLNIGGINSNIKCTCNKVFCICRRG